MGTVIVTPDNIRMLNELRGPAETFLGKNPGSDGRKIANKGEAWTMTRYKAIARDIKQLKRDEPVTLLNLNCFPLKINGGVYFPDEIAPCPLDKPYTVHVIRETRWGHRDIGCDVNGTLQMEPVPAIPMVLATEYIREYVQQDGGFGGVLCYTGDRDPSTFKRGDTITVPEVAYDENGEMYVNVTVREFHEALNAVKHKRNETLMRRLQSANSWYENDSQRMNVNDTHRNMARLAHAEGLIPELPRWVMVANTLLEKQVEPCPSCMAIPKAGAILCTNCEHVFKVLEAYRYGRIAYGAVEMERLDADGWKEANRIKAERDKARGVKSTTTDVK